MNRRALPTTRLGGLVLCGLLLGAFGYACGGRSTAPSSAEAPRVQTPNPDPGVAALDRRKKAQQDASGAIGVFHDFQFADKLPESGITFLHRIVEDAGKHYKAVHYDHGNGIAVADVDGDGLYDIYFVNQVGGNQLWKNLGGGRFKNITNEAGVGLRDRISVTASFADIDNDGDQDLFVTTVRGGNALFENDGHGRFRDITQEAGLSLAQHSSGAVFFDYDNDGLLDLLVCNVGRYTSDVKGPDGAFVGLPDAFLGHLHPDRFESPILYKNLGHNRFRDVTADVGLHIVGWSGDASFADLNGDRRPDLFVLNMQGQQHYLENVGGQKFIDRTREYFPKAPWGAMGIKFFDYDNDGRPDLLITDMHSDMAKDLPPEEEQEKAKAPAHAPDEVLGGPAGQFIFGNALYHNVGRGKFEEVSDRLGVENYWPWGPSIGDVNADGWDDVFIGSGMNYPFRYGINSLLLNDRGEKFADAEFLLGIEPRRDRRTHTPWFELDCLQEGLGNDLCRGQSGRIVVMAPLGTRSAVIFDVDDDGDLDIVTNEFNAEPQVLISNLSERRQIHWLKVLLTGTTSNRNGLGATVKVTAGGHVYTKYNDGKSGYLSQSSLPLYFGLGDAATVDRIEVEWPSGRTQTETRPQPANHTITLVEPR